MRLYIFKKKLTITIGRKKEESLDNINPDQANGNEPTTMPQYSRTMVKQVANK